MIVFTFRGRPIFARGKAMVAYTYYIQQQDEGIHPYPELRPAPRCADRLSPVVLLYLYIYAHNPQTHTRNANETLPFCGDTLSVYSALLAVGTEAPDFSLPTVDGEATIALSDYQGRYLVIDFWASWCPDCRKANPRMVDLYKRYADEAVGISFLGVSFDTDREACLKAVEKDGITWPQVSELKKWKETEISRLYGIRWIPTVYVVDNAGKVLYAGNNLDDLEELLRYLGGVGSGETE